MAKIGIVGLAASGKDTVAEMLHDLNWYPIKKYADKLKSAARSIFGADFDNRDIKELVVRVHPDLMLDSTFNMLSTIMTNDELLKAGELYDYHLGLRNRISPREYQQILGTEIGRAVSTDIWTRDIKNFKGDCIVSDVRFENELLDTTIFVARKGVNVPKHIHASEALASEWHLINVPTGVHVIYNDGTLDDLRAKVYDLNKLIN